jgi:hypothetical protein
LGFGWAFHVGGTNHDAGNAITTDSSGSLYVTGWFTSSTVNFDPNNPSNAYNTLTNPGSVQLQFIAKYSSNMTFQWVTGLGTSNWTTSGSIAVDAAGHVYVVDPGTNGATNVFQLDANSGTIRWNVAIAGSNASAPGGLHAGVAVGPSGDVYVTGRNASAQAFVAKLDPSGNVLWNQPVGGSNTDGLAVAVDSAEHVYVAYASVTTTTSHGKKSSPPPPTYNIQVANVNALNGSTLWSGSMGNYGISYAGVAVDSAGNVYVAGGGGPFFVAKLAPSSNGSLSQSWKEQFSGDFASGVAVDGTGNAYTTGSFSGSVNFDPGPATFILQGSGDCFVSELDTNGIFVTALDTVRGVPPNDRANVGRAIALDSSGNLYTTGGLRGTADFDPGSGTYDLSSTLNGPLIGYQDIFVSQLTRPSSQPPKARGPATRAHALNLDQAPTFLFVAGSATAAAHFLADNSSQGQTKILPVRQEAFGTSLKNMDLTTSIHPAWQHTASPVTVDRLFADLGSRTLIAALAADAALAPLA